MKTYRFLAEKLTITRKVSGDVVYFDAEDEASGARHRLYEIEYEAARLLDGKRTTEKVAKLLHRRFGFQSAEVDVDRFARQLLAVGFVEEL